MFIFYPTYNAFFSLLLLITAVFQSKMHCMENANTQYYFVSLQKTAITALPLMLASQLPGTSGYVPGTPGACFIECTANCTDYMPPLCELNWLAGFFLISFGPAVITVGGGAIGYYAGLFFKKHSQYNKNINENTPLIN